MERGPKEVRFNECTWTEPFPVPTEAGACTWKKVALVLSASGASVSSSNISGCGAPSFSPSRLPLYSLLQFSPWVCSLSPTFQHPASTCIGGDKPQAWPCRAVAWTICVDLILSLLLTDWLLGSDPPKPLSWPR